MTEPQNAVYSPDGQWLWSGREWIPAPPQAQPPEPSRAPSPAVAQPMAEGRRPQKRLPSMTTYAGVLAVLVVALVYFIGGSSGGPTVPYGSAAKYGDGLQVVAASTGAQGDDCFIFQTDSGCQYALTITNSGSKPARLDPSKLHLIDSNGRSYGFAAESTAYALTDGLTLQPGETSKPLNITFLLPAHTAIKYMSLPHGRMQVPGQWEVDG